MGKGLTNVTVEEVLEVYDDVAENHPEELRAILKTGGINTRDEYEVVVRRVLSNLQYQPKEEKK